MAKLRATRLIIHNPNNIHPNATFITLVFAINDKPSNVMTRTGTIPATKAATTPQTGTVSMSSSIGKSYIPAIPPPEVNMPSNTPIVTRNTNIQEMPTITRRSPTSILAACTKNNRMGPRARARPVRTTAISLKGNSRIFTNVVSSSSSSTFSLFLIFDSIFLSVTGSPFICTLSVIPVASGRIIHRIRYTRRPTKPMKMDKTNNTLISVTSAPKYAATPLATPPSTLSSGSRYIFFIL